METQIDYYNHNYNSLMAVQTALFVTVKVYNILVFKPKRLATHNGWTTVVVPWQYLC